MYITDQSTFLEFLSRARTSSVLAFDTEFLREKTYYPRLCLLQLATDEEIALVDPFEVRDLSPLADVLDDPSVMKLAHACDQDLEILVRATGTLPRPLFDTQAAAALLGHTQQVGYGVLVSARCGVTLRKADSYTDWSRRPLSKSQLSYAADDVKYLPEMYRGMRDELEAKGRLHWLDREFEELCDPARFQEDPRERYRRLKHAGRLSRRQLSAAREVAAWREETAQRRDLPRKWVLTDEQIVEACKRDAATIDQLFMVRGVRERLNTADARTVTRLLKKGFDAPADTWPDLGKAPKGERNVDVETGLMNALVHLRARENGIAAQTLAGHDELTKLARGHREGLAIMSGWRRTLIGDELVDLLEGRISMRIGPRGPEVVRD